MYIYKIVELLPPQNRSEIFNYWLIKDKEYSMVSDESIEKAQENQPARQTVYDKWIPSTEETTPLKVGMEIITQATMKIGRIVYVSKKLSEVLVEFVDQVSHYQLSGFWDEVELIF